MGFISHYISDLACFPHVTSKNFPDHGDYEAMVSGRTDSCEGTGRVSAGNPYLSIYAYECFNLEVNSLMVSNQHRPEYISRMLAYDTCFDPDEKGRTGFQNAEWMVNNYNSLMKGNWPGGGHSWRGHCVDQRAIWVSWGESGDDTVLKRYHFMERVEKSLSKAALAVADALSYIINRVGEYQCKGGDPVEKSQQSIIKYVTLYSLMSLVYWAGLMASMYAVQVSAFSKLKL
ncbi:MAG: hypothetical protein EU535_06165 [Promethearchaeota archaeon]|nr:MAG: hypothetical protein EU535_06165 [Candidatus Lokiarchaeota archaeon]